MAKGFGEKKNGKKRNGLSSKKIDSVMNAIMNGSYTDGESTFIVNDEQGNVCCPECGDENLLHDLRWFQSCKRCGWYPGR